PSEFLAGVALRSFGRIVARNRGIVERNLALLRTFFGRHRGRLEWNEPEGGSIAFPRFTGGDADAEALGLRLLADTGVLILPGAHYGYDAAHFRLGFGRANMPEALELFGAWLERGH
ncbi:MAG TPA: hypothetical protein VMC79_16960, partial [Rectinemataceae bacterium]|nr:hypothetical protein [Rectinemataceae bacterium]